MSQGSFPQQQAWQALDALLAAQLAGVDVQPVSEKDFNGKGEIIMQPPSVRTFYAGSGFTSLSDMQRQNYEAVGKFLLLCADEDRTSDHIQQAYVSLTLADRVCGLLAGARLVLTAGDVSEPINLVAIETMPAEGVGTAYGLAIEVAGLAQFPGANANPQGGQ